MLKSLFLRFAIIGDLFSYLWKEKVWVLIPVLIILLLVGALIIFAHSSPVAPFIYTLF